MARTTIAMRALEEACPVAGSGSLIPAQKTYIEQRRTYEGQCKAAGLSRMHGGNQQAAQKARVFLREWFGGKISLEPLADGGLMAHWNQNIGALVSAAVGTFASGGAILSWKSLRTKEIRVR
jgi:hypothetical protein